jgi:sigma-B regulation protein RsbU (phosphoserine phosphatase)
LPYPLHRQAASGQCTEIEASGLPLGTFDDVQYDEYVIELAPGDVFVFATDGLTEARHAHEDYGVARLRQLVQDAAGLSATALGERILEDLEGFMGGAAPSDDVTLVVVKIL